MRYITNHKGYFFTVDDAVEFDAEALDGQEHPNAEAMYAEAARHAGITVEEVEGLEERLLLCNGNLICRDDRGAEEVISDQSAVEYINQFEL